MRPLAVVLALATVLGMGCAPQSEGPSPLVAQNEVLMRTLMVLREAGDPQELAELFHAKAVFDDFPNQTQYRGVREIVGYLTSVHDWAGAVNMSVTAVHASETGATAEWVFSGIQDGPLGELVPVGTGREVVVNGVTIIETEGNLVTRAADYMDVLPIMTQLGVELSPAR